MESEVHQVLGDVKIQEICERFFLGNRGKKIVDRILSRLKSSDLAGKSKVVDSVINQETNGYRKKTAIKKVLNNISGLLLFRFPKN